MKILFSVLFSLFFLGLYGQAKREQLAFGVRMNRNDFFQENSIFYAQTKIKHEFGLGFGINKCFFQERLNPELFYSLVTNVTPFKKFSFQGMASYHLNFYNTNRIQREVHFFNELLFGINLAYGSKFKFFLQIQGGLISESFHSDFYKQTLSAINFSYSAKTGIYYAF